MTYTLVFLAATCLVADANEGAVRPVAAQTEVPQAAATGPKPRRRCARPSNPCESACQLGGKRCQPCANPCQATRGPCHKRCPPRNCEPCPPAAAPCTTVSQKPVNDGEIKTEYLQK